MSFIERALQDSANATTTSGISTSGLIHSVLNSMPGRTIERGRTNLRQTLHCLEEEVLPVPMEKVLYTKHDKLFESASALLAREKRVNPVMSPVQFCKLKSECDRFEEQTVQLYSKTRSTSDIYRSLQKRRYTPSIMSEGSGWEEVHLPSLESPTAAASNPANDLVVEGAQRQDTLAIPEGTPDEVAGDDIPLQDVLQPHTDQFSPLA